MLGLPAWHPYLEFSQECLWFVPGLALWSLSQLSIAEVVMHNPEVIKRVRLCPNKVLLAKTKSRPELAGRSYVSTP